MNGSYEVTGGLGGGGGMCYESMIVLGQPLGLGYHGDH